MIPTWSRRLAAPALATALAATSACDQARPLAGRAGSDGGGLACTSCHGDAGRAEADALLQAAPPRDTAGRTTGGAVGAHQAHLHGGALRAGVACTECHEVPTTLAHASQPAPPAFGPLARAGGAAPAWDAAAGSCASTYCHGATLGAGGTNHAPRWSGGPAEAACGTCHGAPPPSHAPSATDCNACHPATVRADGTIDVAGGRHVDGLLQVVSAHPDGWRDPAQHGRAVADQGLAGCRACHGADLAGGTAGVSCATCHEAAGYPAWQSNCTFCHGAKVAAYTAAGLAGAAPPTGARGETLPTERAVGAHQRHLAGGAIGQPLACADCHVVPADLGHLDGAAQVAFGTAARRGGAAPAWNPVALSCASTYCHGATLSAGGTNQAPRWTGGPSQAACGTCHGAPPATGRHGDHAGRSCGDCHPGYTTTAVNAAAHVDGARQVGNRITAWNPTTRACTGCHGADTW